MEISVGEFRSLTPVLGGSHLEPAAPSQLLGPEVAELENRAEDWVLERPPSRLEALSSLLHAARLKKNAPLLFLLLAGMLTAADVSFAVAAASVGLLIVSSAFMTHVNIITDAELDRLKKPHLMRWMNADPTVTNVFLGVELGLVVGGLAVLAIVAPVVAAALGAFTLLTVLYSYNFLVPSRAVELRLKAHWWGHFLVCFGGYLSLWIAGHFSGRSASAASLLEWLPLFVLVSLSEYSLFLAESAIDAAEERQHRLKTFARLLGRHGSSVLALLVWAVSAAGIAAWAGFGLDARLGLVAAVALGPAALARGVVEVLLALRLERDEAVRFSLPDAVFWGGRLWVVLALAVMR